MLVNSITGPLEFMDDPSHQYVGICGIQLLDERGRVALRARDCRPVTAWFVALRLHGLSNVCFPPHFRRNGITLRRASLKQVIGASHGFGRGCSNHLADDERFLCTSKKSISAERTRTIGLQNSLLASAQASHVVAEVQSGWEFAVHSWRSRIDHTPTSISLGGRRSWYWFRHWSANPYISMFFSGALKSREEHRITLAYDFGMLAARID